LGRQAEVELLNQHASITLRSRMPRMVRARQPCMPSSFASISRRSCSIGRKRRSCLTLITKSGRTSGAPKIGRDRYEHVESIRIEWQGADVGNVEPPHDFSSSGVMP
jgi:hypothetical protein